MKKAFLLICLTTAFLTSCGKNPDDNSPLEETVVTEQDLPEEDADDKEVVESVEEPEATDESESATKLNLIQILTADNYLDEWSDDYVVRLCSASWQSIVLGEESREKYPELAHRLDERNEENQTTFQTFVEEMASSAMEHYTDTPEWFNTYSSNGSYTVQRADDSILSIREYGDEYTGGAHGMYGNWGINYEPSTGEEFELTDVFKGVEELPAILSEKVIAGYADEYETFESLESVLEEYKPEDYNWTMDYQGITFYFSPYEIASYAMGAIEVTIWFDERPDLFDEKFLTKPENGYAMELPMGNEIELDLNHESKDRLMVSTYSETAEEAEYGVLNLCITLNDNSYYEEDYYGYDFDSYVVCVNDAGQERYYLYVEGMSENDYCTLFIYDLNGEELKLCSRLSGVSFCGVWDENAGEYGMYYKGVLSNPQEFELATRMEILGTWSGIRVYKADGKTGIPTPLTEEYSLISSEYPTISTIPLEVIMLPDETKEELPAGTEFYFIRTDGTSYVDARLADGRECRIYVEFEDYRQLINGVDQWECFENLMYAG